MKLIIDIEDKDILFDIKNRGFTPQTETDQVIIDALYNSKPYEERLQGDLISRQDAIDALEEQLDYLQMLNKNENPTAEGKWYGVNWARNTIADLPYKQNERPKGEWRVRHDNHFRCTNCEQYSSFNFNYCPNCGADMKGGAE